MALLLRLVIWKPCVILKSSCVLLLLDFVAFTMPCRLKSLYYFETFVILRLVIWKPRVYFETFKQYYYFGFWWLFYYGLSSEIIVSTLKLLNSTIIGFWWLFYYALSSEILVYFVSTLKLLNSTIIGFLALLNVLLLDFGGSFTTPCHLKSSCLLWNF